MAVSVLQRPGSNKGGADELALFLTKYTGRSLAAQRRDTVTEGLFRTEVLDSAKTGQFTIHGRTGGVNYLAGDNLLTDSNSVTTQNYLQTQAQTEVLINVDRPIVAPTITDKWEKAMTQYPLMELLVNELNPGISRIVDRRRLISIGLGARAAANLTELGAGYRPAAIANLTTDVAVFLDSLVDAKTAYDQKHIPEAGRMVFVAPDLYNFLVAEAYDILLNRDYVGTDSNGDLIRMDVLMWAGWRIIKSTNMPSTNILTQPGDGTRNIYGGDFSDTKALLATPESIGVVTLADMGMSFEAEYKMEYQGTALVAQRTQGCAPLRVEECGELLEASA